MKKITVIIFLTAVFVVTASAQLPLSKGNIFVNANVTELNLTFGDGTQFGLGGTGGYFLADNLALLAGIGLDTFSFDGSSTTTFGLNGGARYYFMPGEKGSFFADGLLRLRKWEHSDAVVGLAINGGYAYFIKNNIALEPMASLWLPFSSGSDVTFSLGGGFTIYF